jgi:hypothetical protein
LPVYLLELDTDDFDRFKSNAILEIQVESEKSQTSFHGTHSQNLIFLDSSLYKLPLTQCYLGLNDQPLGVRVQLFNPDKLE